MRGERNITIVEQQKKLVNSYLKRITRDAMNYEKKWYAAKVVFILQRGGKRGR